MGREWAWRRSRTGRGQVAVVVAVQHGVVVDRVVQMGGKSTTKSTGVTCGTYSVILHNPVTASTTPFALEMP